MSKKTMGWLLGLALSAGPAYAQPQARLVEKVSRKGNELVIPYQKYQLPNGLTLIVHEDHSDPVVHVDVTYHVGSAREEIGKSGFAHFFEHMMFQGSDNVADEQHFKLVSEAGGSLNGTTNRDRTNYFETLPANQLETALWLEADRMGFLLDAVTQKKFEIQRETVKNERGQRYDNTPYGLAGEKVAQVLYPYGHPYSWLTIGYVEDLNRVDVNDLKNFFLRWYGPNNAVLTVGGDVKPEEVVKLAEKYFSSIPAGPAVKNMPAMPARLEQDRYTSYEDNVRFPMLRMVLPSVPMYHPDEPALQAVAYLLGGSGQSSLLYKNFELPQKAVQAYAYNWGSELAGEFVLEARTFPGTSLKETEQLMRQTLQEFEQKGISQEDLNRFKATQEARQINGLSSVHGKVATLAEFQTFTGDANYFSKNLARYQRLTREDVMRAYQTYLKGKPAVLLSVLPKGKAELAAAAAQFSPAKDRYQPGPDEYKGLRYEKGKDAFDRSKAPVPAPAPALRVPDYWTSTFKNGLKLIGTRNDEIPVVTLQLRLEGGQLLDAYAPEKAGLARLTAVLMNEDTRQRPAEAFAAELEKLGSTMHIAADRDETIITVETLKKNLDQTLALLEERLLQPAFHADDFERLKKKQLESIANQATQPTQIANNVYARLLYGPEHILSLPILGTEETVKNITLTDVQAFYNRYYSPSLGNLVAVGDIDQKQLEPKLSFLQKWPARQVSLPKMPAVPAADKTRIYLVDKPDAPQSEIRIGYMALPFDATGPYYKAGLMNFVLGGDFNSRINLNLREAKGYTYGARSGFQGSRTAGPFTAQAGVRGNVTDSAVVEFIKEMRLYRENGITPQELGFIRNAMGQSEARKYETGVQKAAFLSQIVRYDLSRSFAAERSRILKNISKEEIDALTKKHLPLDQLYIVVVGDKSKIRPGLEKLGYELVELDKDGNRAVN